MGLYALRWFRGHGKVPRLWPAEVPLVGTRNPSLLATRSLHPSLEHPPKRGPGRRPWRSSSDGRTESETTRWNECGNTWTRMPPSRGGRLRNSRRGLRDDVEDGEALRGGRPGSRIRLDLLRRAHERNAREEERSGDPAFVEFTLSCLCFDPDATVTAHANLWSPGCGARCNTIAKSCVSNLVSSLSRGIRVGIGR